MTVVANGTLAVTIRLTVQRFTYVIPSGVTGAHLGGIILSPHFTLVSSSIRSLHSLYSLRVTREMEKLEKPFII